MVFEKLKEIFGRVMPQCDPSTITMDSVLTCLLYTSDAADE